MGGARGQESNEHCKITQSIEEQRVVSHFDEVFAPGKCGIDGAHQPLSCREADAGVA
jgi:hypothetical protein